MSKSKKRAWAENGLEDWGAYMNAKKDKLEEQFEEAAKKEFQDATSLFSGIAIFVNGYTNPCSDELKRLMMAHGGVYHHYMRSKVTTHIIASNLPYTKIVAYRKSQNPLPICKPEWITDSLKANKLLDWRPYLLYSNASVSQPQLQFQGKTNSDSSFAEKTNLNLVQENDDDTEKVSSSVKKHENPGVSSDVRANSAALCSKDSEFLSEFYNNSRLHHISTMGATFKEYVNELRAKNTSNSFPGLERLKSLPKNREKANYPLLCNDSDSEDDLFGSPASNPKIANENVIMHIDMDCFFVSVGLRNRPELKGLPVAVTHAKGNKQTSKSKSDDAEEEEGYGSFSEIASCSYEARKAGLKNGMFLGQALKLCPNLKTIKYDFEGYKEVSYLLYNTVASYTLNIEAVSCDEMYADVSTVLKQSQLTPLQFASFIREEIREKTGCPVSTGFGSNKLQARLATRKAKPDGQFYLETAAVQEYIGSMVVRDLPGVGSSTMQLLQQLDVHTCSDLQNVSLNTLREKFGKKTGEMLHNMCRGIDNSKLNFEHVRKSVSAEVNYGIRFENGGDAEEFLKKLSLEVCSRLQKANSKGRSVTLKLMIRAKDAPKDPLKFMGHGLCDNFTKSKNLIAPVDDPAIITKEVISLWNQMQQLPEDVRGIGIQIARLETAKVRSGGGYMLNFISKAKSSEVEVSSAVQRPSEARRSTADLKVESRSIAAEETKTRGLKAFLVPKAQASNENVARAADKDEISEEVLAELPEDIRREILNSRGCRRAPEPIEPQPSTSRAPDFCVKEPLAAPLRLSDEKTQIKSKNSVDEIRMENIDAAVLNELPEDIRREILGSTNAGTVIKPKEADKPTKSRQSQQENFFKHTKSTSGKSGKASMPAIEEIDMSVLIELPEDIRNEIINEYKAKKQTMSCKNGEDGRTGSEESSAAPEQSKSKENDVAEESNVSFSQVDPEFLAALTDDMRNDVEMYCKANRRKNAPPADKTSENRTNVPDIFTKNRNFSKLDKKNGQKAKGNKRTNSAKGNARKIVKKSPIIVQGVDPAVPEATGSRRDDHQTSSRFLESEFSATEAKTSLNQRQEIISHHSSFVGKRAKSDEEEMLTSLVNYLFTLPVQQVKMQIQTWISKSEDVNEIDLLSLATFLSMLPKKKRLEDLHIFLKTMHRCIVRTGSCIWHGAYRRTTDHVQRYMQIEYKSNLMLPRIECDSRECEN